MPTISWYIHENPEDAFYREVAEETGCKVEIIKYLGVTEEYKYKNNFKQISYIFVSKVIEDTQKLNLTQKEKLPKFSAKLKVD